MGDILANVADALDPLRRVLFNWVGIQPCAKLPAQGPQFSKVGVGFMGVTCNDNATTLEGGIASITLNTLALNGSLPVEVRRMCCSAHGRGWVR